MRLMLSHLGTAVIVVWALVACQSTQHAAMVQKPNSKSAYLLVAHDARAVTQKPQDIEGLRTETSRLQAKLKKSPSDIDAYNSLAQIRLVHGDPKAAQSLAQQALAIDYRSRDAKVVLANVAYLEKRYETAQSLLKQLGGENAQESEVLNLMACLAWIENDQTNAERLFLKAAKKNPDDMAAHMNAGLLLLRRENLAAAAVQFKEVLRVVPDNADAKVHLGIVYAQQGRGEAARELYKDARSQSPRSSIVLFNLAVTQKRAGRYKEAVATLKEFMSLKNISYRSQESALALLEEIKMDQATDKTLSNDELNKLLSDAKEKTRGVSPSDVADDMVVPSFAH